MNRIALVMMAAFAIGFSAIAKFVAHVSLKISVGTFTRKSGWLKSILILIPLFSAAQVAYANWYAGNTRSGVYGLWATIYTPSAKPYMVQADISGQDHWVSLSQPNWIQTGWHVSWYQGSASSYWEVCTNGCYGLNDRMDVGTQNWGYSKEYLIEYRSDMAPDMWCAYVASARVKCDHISTAPVDGQVQSEVKYSPDNEISTTFTEVRYKNAAGQWNYLDQNNYSAELPYGLTAYVDYAFNTFRWPHFTYLPTASK
jgi:hypothetical protein